MNKLKKLGKGLGDISYLFISGEEENSPAKDTREKHTDKNSSDSRLSTKSICLIGNYCDDRDAFLVVNLSLALARLGMRIAVADMDRDLCCMNFFLGKKPEQRHRVTSKAVIEEGPLGVKLIGMTPALLGQLPDAQTKSKLALKLDEIEKNVDLILVSIMQKDLQDAKPLIKDSINEFLVLVPPDKQKMIIAYKIIKSIFSDNPLAKIGTIITEIDHMYEIDAVYEKMSGAVRKFLDKELHKYGFLFKLKQEVDSKANIASFYDADLTACISNIAQIIVLRLSLNEANYPREALFKKILGELTVARQT